MEEEEGPYPYCVGCGKFNWGVFCPECILDEAQMAYDLMKEKLEANNKEGDKFAQRWYGYSW